MQFTRNLHNLHAIYMTCSHNFHECYMQITWTWYSTCHGMHATWNLHEIYTKITCTCHHLMTPSHSTHTSDMKLTWKLHEINSNIYSQTTSAHTTHTLWREIYMKFTRKLHANDTITHNVRKHDMNIKDIQKYFVDHSIGHLMQWAIWWHHGCMHCLSTLESPLMCLHSCRRIWEGCHNIQTVVCTYGDRPWIRSWLGGWHKRSRPLSRTSMLGKRPQWAHINRSKQRRHHLAAASIIILAPQTKFCTTEAAVINCSLHP